MRLLVNTIASMLLGLVTFVVACGIIGVIGIALFGGKW
jgi:hypothetical protein